MILAEKINVMDLVELQLIENALSARFTEIERLKNYPELIAAEKKLEESRSKNEEINSNFHELEIKRKKLEDSVEINNEKIKSNEKKLFSGTITDAKELSNYQEEVEILKDNNSKLEDQVLEIMEEQDPLEPDIEALKREMNELDSIVKRINNEIEEKHEVLKHNIEGLSKRKEDVVARIPSDHLKRYNETKTKKGGIAVSVIKDNFCGVCNMEIPAIEAEKFIDSEILYRCPLCGRISVLYQPEIDEIKKEFEI